MERKNIFLYILLGIIAVVIPIILWQLNLPIISNSYGINYELIEIFGFISSVLIFLIALIEIKVRYKGNLIDVLSIIVWAFLSFHFLVLITEYSFKSWDYECYEYAARAIIYNKNPYDILIKHPITGASAYLYPPLIAQLIAKLYSVLKIICPISISGIKNSNMTWYLVFYLFQCYQFFSINLAYYFCYKFARKIGLKGLKPLFLTTAIFLFNSQIIRTLRHNQVNIIVLVLILLGLLYYNRYTVISGLAIALGVHIKVYPILILLPWLLTRKWRVIFTSILSFFVIVFFQTKFFYDWTIWKQFLIFSRTSFPKGTYFRDNSLHSIVYNIIKLLARLTNFDTENFGIIINYIVWIVLAGIVIWFIVRYNKRKKNYLSIINSSVSQYTIQYIDILRFYGHSMDALALMFFLSPMVWAHHYVLTIPIVIWAYAIKGKDKLWLVSLGFFLMLVIPTFDFFPFSYTRIVGLFILLLLTSPCNLHNYIKEKLIHNSIRGNDKRINELFDFL